MSLFKDFVHFTFYRVRARKWNAFHSPFLFELFSYACDETLRFPEFEEIEKHRKLYLQSREMISRKELGAGSVLYRNDDQKSISTIASSALSLPFQCRFMSRIARFISAESVLEFGTCLGISTAYLSIATPSGKVVTVEGDQSSALLAHQLFSKMHLNNIQLLNHSFDDFLKTDLHKLDKIDFLFLDGNHRREALLSYYLAMRHLVHVNSIIIVDDIHWSREMEKAWKEITNMPEVTQSVDCYQFGVLLFNPDFLAKQNHKINLPLKAYFKN